MNKELKKQVVGNRRKSGFNGELDCFVRAGSLKPDTFAYRFQLRGNEGGSILLMVAVLLVLLTLGSGMALMFGTTSLQTVGHNLQLRATNLSEAGFRYAAGEYNSAGDLAHKYQRLEVLNGETVTLLDNDGSFELEVNPYWFVTTMAYSKDTTSITVKVPGKFPNGFEVALPASGRVRIGLKIYDYTGGNATAEPGTAADTFSITLTQKLFREKPNNSYYYKTFDRGDRINGIWGSSINNIYAVGSGGLIKHSSNGKKDSWRNDPAVPDNLTSENLNGVYGASKDFIYTVGDTGTILYYGGSVYQDKWHKVENITSQTLNSVWGSDRTGLYAVGNNGTIVFLGYPSEMIGGHVLPLSKNAELSSEWTSAGKYLSYTVQAKNVWGDALKYAASGISFRWHEVETGKYAGYGLSLMQYAFSDDENDFIPNTIKPEWQGTDEKNDKLLVVLWEQYLQGGAENRRWLAYKDISNDSKMKKANGTPRDLDSLIVRVEEKRVDGVKVNDINVYYGNAEKNSQSGDAIYNNTDRYSYNPTFASGHIQWPVFDLDNWTDCPNGPDSIACSKADFCTLVDDVSVAVNPVKNDDNSYWKVNPKASSVELRNNFTIRTSTFTSPEGDYFGSQSKRSEIALHVFGNIGDNGSQELVSFADFAVQLGTNSYGVNTESSFGSLQ